MKDWENENGREKGFLLKKKKYKKMFLKGKLPLFPFFPSFSHFSTLFQKHARHPMQRIYRRVVEFRVNMLKSLDIFGTIYWS